MPPPLHPFVLYSSLLWKELAVWDPVISEMRSRAQRCEEQASDFSGSSHCLHLLPAVDRACLSREEHHMFFSV